MTQDNQPSPDLLAQFDIAGHLEGVGVLKRGHINDTYVSVWSLPGGKRRYVHQRVNRSVFKDVPAVMNNIEIILAELRAKTLRESPFQPLVLVPTRQGKSFLIDESGEYFRTYEFVENTVSFDICEEPQIALEAARSFGLFHQALSQVPLSTLQMTIPGYQDVPGRFDSLQKAVSSDVFNRAFSVKAEIDFCLGRENITTVISDLMKRGSIPERLTHGDTKINNVLFSKDTGKGIAICDLDTCMPGYALYDFGDLVRTSTTFAAEDEKDYSKIRMEMPLFKALVTGTLEFVRESWNEAELSLMAFSGKLLTFSLGLRFLTDYLNGDQYFKIHRPEHNLERARAQLKLVEFMEQHQSELEEIVEQIKRARPPSIQ